MISLLQFDENLFHFINSGCQNPVFDWLMPLLRNKYVWVPLYLFIVGFLLLNFEKKGLFIVLALVLAVGISDNVSSRFIKKNVQRLRPCKVLEPAQDMHLLVPCGSGFSFPSTHAANHFTVAVFLIFALGNVFRRIKIPLLLWATAIAFAQVYVGVHFPLDVLAGALLGWLIGWGVWLVFRRFLVDSSSFIVHRS
ncbi:MAG: phosphatase PAP2 family protein [Bacteroidetes bacterium]|nr:phosphatase PAP2 family protein [Bacteroidota bacterium]